MSWDGSVAAENRRPGTTDWGLTRPALAREIEGYAGATSVNRGEVITLHVHTTAPTYRLEVFRMGWYGGLGARRLAGPFEMPGTAQQMPVMDPVTGLVDCGWPASHRLLTADADGPWPGGVYLARLTTTDQGAQSYILFVLRDDERPAALLVQLGVTTYQAYNPWGGKSLYHWGSSGGQRASQVSFNRPYAANPQNPAAAIGMGAGEFLTNLQPHPDRYGPANAGWDCNMLRWLEREGLDLAYVTNLDTHARPALLRRRRAWLSIGHDEYWSAAMRRQVEAARDAGVHLGFFGANAAYWQVRLAPSPVTGEPDRTLVCHKKARHDPAFAAGAPADCTDKWRSEAVGRPEEDLVGVMYTADPVDGDIVVTRPGHWIFEGSGLRAGDRLPGLLGYEVDAAHGPGPAGRVLLAESPWRTLSGPPREGVSHMSLYQAPSGACVFATGSIQWAWGLDDFNVPALRTSRRSDAAACITRKLLARFLAPAPA